MEYYAVIDTRHHRIIANYYSDKGEDLTKPGPDYDQEALRHMVVPTELTSTPFLTITSIDNIYVFQEDMVAKEQSVKEQWTYLREVRNKKLAECDWRMTVSDIPMSTEQRERWAAYRQTLRDLPANTVDPAQVVWPEPPM